MKFEEEKITWTKFEQASSDFISKQAVKIDQNTLIYIFGAGRFGRDLSSAFIKKGYKVIGFVETFPKEKICDGIKVYSWENLPNDARNALFAIGIYNRDTPIIDLIRLVKSKGYLNTLTPLECYELFGEELGWRYWLSDGSLLIENIESLKEAYNMFSDDVSKSCFLKLIYFRLGKNISYSGYKHQSNQYFNELTLPLLKKGARYVDCGAYNGDTYFELTRFISLGDSYLFEPDPINYHRLSQAVLSSNLDPTLLPLAVSDKYKILSFTGGEAGTISAGGLTRIAAVALDDVLINKKIDFIKFDVEGSEIDAIKGASSLIANSRPILAISLYHRPVDLWEIPDLLRKVCCNYSFHLRQHYFNSFDSVIYAIPNTIKIKF